MVDLFKGEVGDPIDELPDDAQQPDAQPIIPYTYHQLAEFRAVMKSARINHLGHLSITVEVPAQDKLLALPVTDCRGVMMVFAVYEPMKPE